MKNIQVVYHANCLDGLGAHYAAWLYFKDDAEYIPMGYADTLEIPRNAKEIDLYILDFSFSKGVTEDLCDKYKAVRVIDHHKSSAWLKEMDIDNLIVYHSDKASGCILAWDYFHGVSTPIPQLLVSIEDRDLWRFTHKDTKAICAALYPLTIGKPITVFADMVERNNSEKLAGIGNFLLSIEERERDTIAKRAYKAEIMGEPVLCVNTEPKHSSELGNRFAKEEKYGITYTYDGAKKLWLFSVRSVGDVDCTTLASKFGGGGHKNAAGFTASSLEEVFGENND